MIINKYKFDRNTDGYLIGFYTVEENEEFVGQMSQHPTACEGYTKFINGEFVIDEAKHQEIIEEKRKQERIAELKAYLNETDYIYAKCTETGEDVNVVYAEVVAKRKEARKEIQELEGE